MNDIQLIYWTRHQMYYAGFDPDTGALWTNLRNGAFWLESDEHLFRHMRVLTLVEGIINNELLVQKLESCSKD